MGVKEVTSYKRTRPKLQPNTDAALVAIDLLLTKNQVRRLREYTFDADDADLPWTLQQAVDVALHHWEAQTDQDKASRRSANIMLQPTASVH
jgi:hypothetical protein